MLSFLNTQLLQNHPKCGPKEDLIYYDSYSNCWVEGVSFSGDLQVNSRLLVFHTQHSRCDHHRQLTPILNWYEHLKILVQSCSACIYNYMFADKNNPQVDLSWDITSLFN